MRARIQIKPTPISTVRRLLEKRIFAVPEIQREFVWNPQRVCALLDSIYHEYPVGSVMVWRTKKGYSSLVRHKLHILPHYNNTIADIVQALGVSRATLYRSLQNSATPRPASGNLHQAVKAGIDVPG